jgi:hypothetical protein
MVSDRDFRQSAIPDWASMGQRVCNDLIALADCFPGRVAALAPDNNQGAFYD